jgi:hypothetical protein
MNRPSAAPFPARLALARRMVARGPGSPPIQIADQLDAAGREMRGLHDRLGQVLPVLEPERHWRHRTDIDPTDDTRALLLAAVLGCVNVCVHLRRGGPRPAFCRLPLRRVDCGRCSQTRWPTATGADECDVCGATETDLFYPFAVNRGPLLIAGDVCGGCAEALGIRAEVA